MSGNAKGEERPAAEWNQQTDTMQLAEAMQLGEEVYRSLVAALNEGIVLQVADGTIVANNLSAERILGLTTDQLCGRTSLDPRWRSVHEDGSPFPGHDHPAMVTLRTGEPCNNVIMGVHKPDGSLTWISINSQPLHRPNEKAPYGVVCSFFDITDRKQAEDSVRASERRLRVALQAGGALAFTWEIPSDRVCRFYSVEPSLPETLGPLDTLDCVRQVVHPDDLATFDINLANCLAEGTEYYNEFRIRRSDGTIRWIEERGLLERDSTGAPLRLTGVSIDVTEKRRSKQALRESEDRFRHVLDFSPAYVYLKDPAGRYQFVNRRLVEAFQIPLEGWLGKTASEILPADTAEQFNRHDESVRQSLSPHQVEESALLPDGREITCLSVQFPLFDSDGQPYAFGGIATDITEWKRAEAELHRSDALLHAVAQGTTDAVFVKDRLGRYLLFNEAASHFVGKPIDAVLGKDDTELFDPESAQRVQARDRLVMETGEANTDEETLTAAGVTRTYLAMKGPYRDQQGHIAGVLGISRDITDRKRTEERLKTEHAVVSILAQADDLQQAAADVLQVICTALQWQCGILWVMDPHAKVLRSVNRWHSAESADSTCCAAASQLTWDPGQGLPGRVWMTGQAECQSQPGTAEPSSSTSEFPNSDFRMEFAFPLRVGTRTTGIAHFLATTAQPPDDFQQSMLEILGSQIGQFIEHQRSEDALRLFRALADKSTDQIQVIDPETGRFLDVNERACLAYGYSRAAFLNLCWSDIDQGRTARERSQELLELGGRNATFESYHSRQDGSTFPVEVNMSLIRLDRDYLVAGVRDITDRKRMEEQYRQSQKMEAIGRLAGGVAHDFNNLLTVINGYADLLLTRPPAPEAARTMLAAIRDAGERAAGLTAQLLAFSRKAIVEPREMDVNRAAESAAGILQRLIGEDVRLVTDLCPRLPRVKIDPGQLEQVFLNLAVNSRDAMPCGGLLTISTALVHLPSDDVVPSAELSPGPYVELIIADTGEGMTAETKARAFEPFFTTKGVGKGTGLGLATVYGIVSQAGGIVTVKSEVGQGAEFRIYLPAVESARVARNRPVTATPRAGHETVLLAEDEEGVRRLVRETLEMQGYRVLEATSGTDALNWLTAYQAPIHLFITDVVMPDIGGARLANAVRSSCPGVQVLYMSGYTDDEIVRYGIRTATDYFIQKPFSVEQLINKVREVLDRPLTTGQDVS